MQWAPNAVLTAFRAVTQLASHWVTWDIQFLWRELCLVSNHVETGCFCRQWFPFSFSPLVWGLKDVQVHLKPAWTSAEVCLKKKKKKKKKGVNCCRVWSKELNGELWGNLLVFFPLASSGVALPSQCWAVSLSWTRNKLPLTYCTQDGYLSAPLWSMAWAADGSLQPYAGFGNKYLEEAPSLPSSCILQLALPLIGPPS